MDLSPEPARTVRLALPGGTRNLGRFPASELARIIRQHAALHAPDLPEYAREDAAVFHGDRLVAAIRRGPDGRAEVTRFDD